MTPADIEQRAQALDLTSNVLVQAPAGSGKTGLLVQRLLACLASVDRPEQVIAITFTRKASAEMRARVAMALESARHDRPSESHAVTTWELAQAVLERDAEQGWHLLNNPSRLRIQTIDSLNQYLAVQAPLLSGLASGTTAEDARLLYRRAVFRLFAGMEHRDTDATLRAAMQRVLAHFENRLDRALPELEGMLAWRDQWLALVLRGAAQSEQDWNAALESLVATRLAFCGSVLPLDLADRFARAVAAAADPARYPRAGSLTAWPEMSAENLPVLAFLAATLLTRNGSFRKQITVREGFPPGEATTLVKQLLVEWQDQPEEVLLAINELAALPKPVFPPEMIQLRDDLCHVLHALVVELKLVFAAQGQVDFPEVASRAQWAMKQGDIYTPVMERQDQNIRHLLVDEMQDTSRTQVELLELLTAGWVPGDGRSLFMVGDPMQSIYAFRQADVRLFLGMMENRLLGALPLRVLALSANFRSQAGLIDWFNASFSRIFPSEANIWAGLASYHPSTATRDALTMDATCWHPSLEGDRSIESRQIADVAEQIRRDDPEASVAVLVRARKHLTAVLRELRQRGIGYQCQDVDPVAGMPAVADAIGLIRACWHAADVTAWTVLLRAPFVGLAWADLVQIAVQRSIMENRQDTESALRMAVEQTGLSTDGRQRVARLLGMLDSTAAANPLLLRGFADRIETLWSELGGWRCYARSDLPDVRRLFAVLREHCGAGQLHNIDDFDLAVQRLFAQTASEGVQVLTMHKAKGLEYDYVLLPGLGRTSRNDDSPVLAYETLGDEGFLLAPKPPIRNDSPGQMLYDYVAGMRKERDRAEHLRLLYVAVTRAKKQLHLFGSVKEDKDGNRKPVAGSLLHSLWPVCQQAFTDFADVPAKQGDDMAWSVPLRHRCAPDWQPQVDNQVWRPEIHEDDDEFSETGESGQAATVATLIGEMYHAAMEKMLAEGVWQDGGQSRRAAMSAGFRRRGMPEPDVKNAVDRVLTLLDKTLASDSGQWLLKKREWAESEYALQGHLDGRFHNTRLDLCFEDGGVFWVVDYKAAVESVAGNGASEYVQHQRERYSAQLALYAKLLASERGVDAAAIKKALFLPELGQLEILN